MLANIHPLVRPVTSVSSGKHATQSSRVGKSALTSGETFRATQIRSRAPRSASRSFKARSIYRAFSISSQASARASKVIKEEQKVESEENFEDDTLFADTLPLHCVFKVLAVETPPNYFIPWQKKSSKDCIGSGFAVKTPHGVKLLTNAHVVENATTVRIRRSGSPFMYTARVAAIANECDLAELVVSDPAFWRETNELEALKLIDIGEEEPSSTSPLPTTLTSATPAPAPIKKKTAIKSEKSEIEIESKSTSKKAERKKKNSAPTSKTLNPSLSELKDSAALEMGGLPELHSKVTVIGYPTGGDNVSVTHGVVSRIEPQSYTDSPGHELLAIQIDAAINPGNSGGPALDEEHRVVGVAFCSLQGAENIGYIIPTPIILHFLEDVHRNKGAYTGFVRLGLITQSLDQNPAACDYFKLKKGMSGLLVANVDVVGDAHNKIKKDDVLLAVDGVALANDGTVPFRRRERIHFEYLLMQKFRGDLCKITVWRDGKELDVDIKVKPKILELVPSHATCPVPDPPYIVYGGLVFTRLSFAYIAEYGEDWYNTAPRELLHQAFHAKHMFEGQEIVILSHVLVDDCNFGYNRTSNLSLKRVNGVEVENLQHLHNLIKANTEKFIRFDLDENITVIINHEQALEAATRIQHNHGVPKLSSFEAQQAVKRARRAPKKRL